MKSFRICKSLALVALPVLASLGTLSYAQDLPLPETPVTPTITAFVSDSYVTIKFPNIGAGYAVNSSETYLGWCIKSSEKLLVYPKSESNAQYQLVNAFADSNTNWPLVNWVLNHRSGENGNLSTSVVDIQEVVWYLLQGTYVTLPPFTADPYKPSTAAQALLSQAETYGHNFVPEPGQIIAVILRGISQPGNPGPPQPFCIEVKYMGPPVGSFCPLTQGYWKNHISAWPQNTPIYLGSKVYNTSNPSDVQALLAVFDTPVRGNAITNLEHQLIAAELNLASGSGILPIASTLRAAIPLAVPGSDVPSSSQQGQTLTNLAGTLDAYNSGMLTGSCMK